MIKQFIDSLIAIIMKLIPSPESRIKRMELNEEKIRQKSINKALKLSNNYERIIRRNKRKKAKLERKANRRKKK